MGRKEAGAKNNRLSHGAALGGVEPMEPEPKNPGRGVGENPSSLRIRAFVRADAAPSSERVRREMKYPYFRV